MKTSLGKLLCVLVLGLVICLPGMAGAVTLSGGIGYYWSAPGTFSFDQFDTYLTGGSETFSNALVGTNAATIDYGGNTLSTKFFTGSYVSPTKSTASGSTAVTTMNWNYNFTGSSLGSFTFDINYFNAGIFVSHENYTWNGSNWSGGGDNNQYVPIPASVLLLGSGLMGLGLLGFRRRQS